MSLYPPQKPVTAKCRSCGAPILWVKMLKSGKLNPVDAEPVANGNVFILVEPDLSIDPSAKPMAIVLDKESLAKMHEDGELLFCSHFATCKTATRSPSPSVNPRPPNRMTDECV
jgi:hypothetical protein